MSGDPIGERIAMRSSSGRTALAPSARSGPLAFVRPRPRGVVARGAGLGAASLAPLDQMAELGLVADRVQIAILVDQVQPESLAQGRFQQAKGFPAVVGILAGRQSVDAGDLIDVEWFRIPWQRLAGVGVRGLAPAEPGVQYSPAGTGRHVVRVEGEELVERRDGLFGAAEVLGKDVGLVLKGRQIARVELQSAVRNPPGPPAGRAAAGPGPATSSRVRRAVPSQARFLVAAGALAVPLLRPDSGPQEIATKRRFRVAQEVRQVGPRRRQDRPGGTSRGPDCNTPASVSGRNRMTSSKAARACR